MASKSVWQTESLTCWEWNEQAGVFKTEQSWPDHNVMSEPARQGLGWQACIWIIAMPGAAAEAAETDSLKMMGERFHVGSLGKDSM